MGLLSPPNYGGLLGQQIDPSQFGVDLSGINTPQPAPQPAAMSPPPQAPQNDPTTYKPSFWDMLSRVGPGVTWGQAAQSARADHYANAQAALAYKMAMAKMAALQQTATAMGQGGDGGATPDGIPGYGPTVRRDLATLSLYDGKPDDAAKILQNKVITGPDGALIDELTGTKLGRVPSHQVVNGFNVDLGAPGAPNFIPKLPDGMVPNGQGGASMLPGVLGGTAALAASQAGGTSAGQLPYAGALAAATANAQQAAEARYAGPKALATASGTQSGIAPFDLVTVPQGDGTTKLMPRAAFLANAWKGGGQLGQTQNPAAAAYQADQGKAGSDAVNQAIGARESALQQRQNALTMLGFVKSHPMNPGTPTMAAAAQYLRALPPGMLQAVGVDPNRVDSFANNTAVYQRLTNQKLLGFGKTLLPSRYTERELMLLKPVAGSLNTPNEAAAYAAAIDGALAQRQIAQADFAAGYKPTSGVPSRQDFERQWANSPQGQRSLFQDPEVWKGVKLNGKPAVLYTQVNGKKVGVFGYRTPYQYVFPVR